MDHKIMSKCAGIVFVAGFNAIAVTAWAGDTLAGIDVSHFQGDVDWSKVADAGTYFAYAKATDGITYVDPHFTQNLSGAAAAGLAVGAYHFFEPNDDAAKQAEHFLSVVKVGRGSMPPVLDVEKAPSSSDPATIAEGAMTWLKAVETATGCRPIIYADHPYWTEYLGSDFADYPLWLADYASKPTLPAGVEDWTLWQYSQNGTIAGVEGHVDLDVFNGTKSDLSALLCK